MNSKFHLLWNAFLLAKLIEAHLDLDLPRIN